MPVFTTEGSLGVDDSDNVMSRFLLSVANGHKLQVWLGIAMGYAARSRQDLRLALPFEPIAVRHAVLVEIGRAHV